MINKLVSNSRAVEFFRYDSAVRQVQNRNRCAFSRDIRDSGGIACTGVIDNVSGRLCALCVSNIDLAGSTNLDTLARRNFESAGLKSNRLNVFADNCIFAGSVNRKACRAVCKSNRERYVSITCFSRERNTGKVRSYNSGDVVANRNCRDNCRVGIAGEFVAGFSSGEETESLGRSINIINNNRARACSQSIGFNFDCDCVAFNDSRNCIIPVLFVGKVSVRNSSVGKFVRRANPNAVDVADNSGNNSVGHCVDSLNTFAIGDREFIAAVNSINFRQSSCRNNNAKTVARRIFNYCAVSEFNIAVFACAESNSTFIERRSRIAVGDADSDIDSSFCVVVFAVDCVDAAFRSVDAISRSKAYSQVCFFRLDSNRRNQIRIHVANKLITVTRCTGLSGYRQVSVVFLNIIDVVNVDSI